MTEEPATHRARRVMRDPWGDLGIAMRRRDRDPAGDLAGHVTLLAVLDDGTFVVADAVRTPLHRVVRAMAA
jgi:hypothetical protein